MAASGQLFEVVTVTTMKFLVVANSATEAQAVVSQGAGTYSLIRSRDVQYKVSPVVVWPLEALEAQNG